VAVSGRLEEIRERAAEPYPSPKEVARILREDVPALLAIAKAAERFEHSLGFPFGSNLHFSNPQLSALTALRAAFAGLEGEDM
jgi:hypothetical protein